MNVRDNLLPSKLEFLLYGVLSIIIAFFGSVRFLTDFLLSGTEFGFESLSEQADQNVDNALQFIDSLNFTPATAVFVFWSVVGVIAFSLGQAVINSYLEFKHDVDVTTKFIHPRRFANLQFWLDAILLTAAHLSLYIMLLMWSALLGFVLAPLSANAVQGAVLDTSLVSIVILLCMLVLLSIGVLIEAVLIKLLFRRKQLVL